MMKHDWWLVVAGVSYVGLILSLETTIGLRALALIGMIPIFTSGYLIGVRKLILKEENSK